MAAMNIENADAKPYWDGVREGRLVLQQCVDCSHVQFPPRHLCSRCWSDQLSWEPATGRATVESMTTVHRAPTPALRDKTPYMVASVVLEEGPRMITNIVGPEAMSITIDDQVTVTFVTDEAGRTLPMFRRAEA